MIYNILLIVQIIAALSIIGLVLIQHGKGADAGAAFGGGSSGTVFGSAGASSFLSRATAILAAVFFANSLALAWIVSHSSGEAGSLVDTVKPTLAPVKLEVPVSDVPGGAAVVPQQQAVPVSDVPTSDVPVAPQQPSSDVPVAAPAVLTPAKPVETSTTGSVEAGTSAVPAPVKVESVASPPKPDASVAATPVVSTPKVAEPVIPAPVVEPKAESVEMPVVAPAPAVSKPDVVPDAAVSPSATVPSSVDVKQQKQVEKTEVATPVPASATPAVVDEQPKEVPVATGVPVPAGDVPK